MISRPLLSATGAFVSAAIAIPPIRSLAKRNGLYDQPGAIKPHLQPTPRLGGAAMGIGVAAGVLLAAGEMQLREWIAVAVVLSVWAIGLADDLWNLTPSFRLASELLAGAVLWSAGWQTGWFKAPSLDLAATCLLFAFLINAVNMLDGVDGLAAGVIGIGAVGLAIARGETISGLVFAGCLVAVCGAILIYNFPPASIFMGDSGSALIGAMAGVLILQGHSGTGGFNGALPLLTFFMLPLGDAGLAIIRRLRTRHSPFRGDRRHYYDLLLQRGWPIRRVLATSYGLAAILVSAGLLCESGRASAFALVGAIAAVLLILAWVLGSFIPDQAAPKPQGAKLLPKIEA
jgi:UDP-GlcNAc:undecaprenyl-phosphate/decaprenyl-phosphate GlcNAc-1-phosphate transferase